MRRSIAAPAAALLVAGLLVARPALAEGNPFAGAPNNAELKTAYALADAGETDKGHAKFKEIADLGDPRAMLFLALYHANAWGPKNTIEKDCDLARRWMDRAREAADQWNVDPRFRDQAHRLINLAEHNDSMGFAGACPS